MPNYDQPREANGRYDKRTPCDACGKSAPEDYITDDEVCGCTDGPGFYLCERKRCVSKRPEGVEERRAYYTAQRAKNQETF